MSFDLAREVLLIEIQKTERTLATLNHTFVGEREKCKRAIAECLTRECPFRLGDKKPR